MPQTEKRTRTSFESSTLPPAARSRSTVTFSFALPLPLPLPTLAVADDPSPRAKSHSCVRVSSFRVSSATRRTCHAATRARAPGRSSVSGARVQLSQWPQGVRASSCPISHDLSESFEDLLKYLRARVPNTRVRVSTG